MPLSLIHILLEDRPIQYTYPLEMPLKDKINAIATKIYRADGVNYSAAASKTLACLLYTSDNSIQQGNPLNIDTRRITWKRCMDMNDRQLR